MSTPLPSLSQFLYHELFSIDSSGSHCSPSASPRQLVYNFLILPYFLERFLLTGTAVCFDCFLYLFTLLPFRVLSLALSLLVQGPKKFAYYWNDRRSHDCVRFVLLVLSWYALSFLPMSRLYHYIRGQSVLKLYVIFNMLQISDRLFASMGEDILDAAFQSFLHGDRRGVSAVMVAVHFVASLVYVFTHALLLFAQVITLNVSVNSDNSSLFILLVSNNFVELKGAVFKRFDAHNLFQMTCSDSVERFQLMIFLAIIIIQNVSHLGWELALELHWLSKALTMCMAVLGGECFVDWIKHGFICKFNMISPRVYSQFQTVIARDFIQTHTIAHAHSNGDSHSGSGSHTTSKSAHSVARRLGLSTFPLAVLVLRVLTQALTTAPSYTHTHAHTSIIDAILDIFTVECLLKLLCIALTFVLLLLLKLFLTVSLLGTMIGRIQQQEHQLDENEKEKENKKEGKSDANTTKHDGSPSLQSSLALVSSNRHYRLTPIKVERPHSLVADSKIKSEMMPPLERVSDNDNDSDVSLLVLKTTITPATTETVTEPEVIVAAPEVTVTSIALSPLPTAATPSLHPGDVLPVHDRVGSVELSGLPSATLSDELSAVDRYAMTEKASIPT